MEFNFLDEGEEDEEVLDLSDLEVKKTPKAKSKKTKKVRDSSGFSFEEDIPPARSITDADVQTKARSAKRSRSVSKMSYDNKKEHGWSFYCAHPHHLPTLCEGAQDEDKVTCTCSCHEERGYARSKPEYIPGSDDEEIILLFN